MQRLKWLIYMIVLTVTTITMCVQPVAAFDTFWHSATTGAMTREYKFSEDATNITQFGNFSGPDFYGPLFDTILPLVGHGSSAIIRPADQQQLLTFEQSQQNSKIRKAAAFMHFDNLYGELNSNWRFNFLFMTLLKNTQTTIDGFYNDQSQNEGTRKMGILMTLGASLHMVQDFYSHSDWVHQDFAKYGFPTQKTSWGSDRGPTWFEFLKKYPDTQTWPIHVSAGIYPPPEKPAMSPLGIPMSHTDFNHDNSQLFYEKESRVEFHNLGAIPASTSPGAHQLYAANTAAQASIEWVSLLEADGTTQAAIDYAKDWDLSKYNPMMRTDLGAALAATLLLSCVANKWDGDHMNPQRTRECSAVTVNNGGSKGNNALGALLTPSIPISLVSFLNEFWAMQEQHPILEDLVAGYGNESSGHYKFAAAPTH